MAITLPTKKRPAVTNVDDYTILLYGPPKVGKTTFCSELNNPLFLATEPGTNALSVFENKIGSWKEFLANCNLLRKPGHGFNMVIVDTVDNLLMFCAEHICKENGVSHESEIPHGKGYSLITAEFQRVITRLAAMPFGLVLVSHSHEVEMKARTGDYKKTMATLTGKQRKFITGFVDMILCFDIIEKTVGNEVKEIRVIRTKQSKYLEAGDRTGKLPPILKLDAEEFKKVFAGAVSGKKMESDITESDSKSDGGEKKSEADGKNENKKESVKQKDPDEI